jgi:hypothetical protein
MSKNKRALRQYIATGRVPSGYQLTTTGLRRIPRPRRARVAPTPVVRVSGVRVVCSNTLA